MTYKHYRRGLGQLAVVAVATVIAASVCWAGGPYDATILKHDGGRISGSMRFLASSKAYEVTAKNAKIRVSASDVARVALRTQPASLAPAIAAVKAGRYAQAIAPLAKIVDDYEMFGPDVVAAQYLAEAYLGVNKAGDAVRLCEELLRKNPKAADNGAFAGIYWNALLKEKSFATLDRMLDDAIRTGPREVAAVALLRRGDIQMQKRDSKAALLDGYLRVVLMYQDITEVQPEALFKAMEAHKSLNEPQFVEKWRKRLLSGYGTSDYAKKLR